MMYAMYAVVATVVLILDLVSKELVIRGMQLGDSIPLIPQVFHLTYVQNTGIAFSLLRGGGTWLIILPMVVMFVVLFYIYNSTITNRLALLACAFIMGGGLGNIVDRIRFGYVVDFFDFRLINFAIFNVADSFVCIGALLMVVYMMKYDRHEKNG